MQLKDFIKSTLVSIATGVDEASEEIKTKDTRIKDFRIMHGSDGLEKRYVEFDVAVTTSMEVSGKIKGGGNVIVASMDVQGGLRNNEGNINRIRFNVLCTG